MDEYKISFITCVNDEVLYQECVRYLRSLNIPNGFKVEMIGVRDSKTMNQGYNIAMHQSDAKYKVYLHQNTYIINKDFIQNVIGLFQEYSKLGMAGVIGAGKLHSSGVWWNSSEKYGKIIGSRNSSLKISEFKEVESDYKPVQVVDGLIIMTQYDLPWREDLFTGWHLSDISQALEYHRAGFEVGVPKQISAWCIHDGETQNVESIEVDKEILLKEYAAEILPLVSVLIPTYNRPQYLKQAIDSVLNQTYKNIELIICDDSTDLLTYEMMQPYVKQYENICYIKNEVRQEINNAQKCLDLAKGVYINFLMDDDLFRFDKVEKMVDYFSRFPKVKLVTSYRRLIDDSNNELPDENFNKSLFDKDTLISGITLGNYALTHLINFIGEPTTVMFIREEVKVFGKILENRYSVINDLVTWLSVMSKGEAVYIAEPLSYFRQHKGQNQRNLQILTYGFSDWNNLIEDARQIGYLKSAQDYKMAIESCVKAMMHVVRMHNKERRSNMLQELKVNQYITNAVKKLIESPDGYTCNMCNQISDEFISWPDLFDSDQFVFEMHNKFTATCPNCGTFDRERAFKYFIEHETNISKTDHLLHIAPERNLGQWLKSQVGKYVAGDLYPSDQETQRIDITDISFQDNVFDAVICSHVLEHVLNDTNAIKEFYRVLKPGGWGILQVPIAINIAETFEDRTVITPEDRLRVFGQDDHVRVYAKDYVNKLTTSGFKVELFNIADKYGFNEATKLGLSRSDNVYIVRK